MNRSVNLKKSAGQHVPALHLSVKAGIMTSISKLSPTVQTLEEKRDALNRCCSGLHFHSCLIFEPEEIESLFNTEVFILCLSKFFRKRFEKTLRKRKAKSRFGAYPIY